MSTFFDIYDSISYIENSLINESASPPAHRLLLSRRFRHTGLQPHIHRYAATMASPKKGRDEDVHKVDMLRLKCTKKARELEKNYHELSEEERQELVRTVCEVWAGKIDLSKHPQSTVLDDGQSSHSRNLKKGSEKSSLIRNLKKQGYHFVNNFVPKDIVTVLLKEAESFLANSTPDTIYPSDARIISNRLMEDNGSSNKTPLFRGFVDLLKEKTFRHLPHTKAQLHRTQVNLTVEEELDKTVAKEGILFMDKTIGAKAKNYKALDVDLSERPSMEELLSQSIFCDGLLHRFNSVQQQREIEKLDFWKQNVFGILPLESTVHLWVCQYDSDGLPDGRNPEKANVWAQQVKVEPGQFFVGHWKLWHALGRPLASKTSRDLRLVLSFASSEALAEDTEQNVFCIGEEHDTKKRAARRKPETATDSPSPTKKSKND